MAPYNTVILQLTEQEYTIKMENKEILNQFD